MKDEFILTVSYGQNVMYFILVVGGWELNLLPNERGFVKPALLD